MTMQTPLQFVNETLSEEDIAALCGPSLVKSEEVMQRVEREALKASYAKCWNEMRDIEPEPAAFRPPPLPFVPVSDKSC